MDEKKEIVKKIISLSGSRSPYDVFCDWIACAALAIQNGVQMLQGPTWRKREEQYIKTVNPYGEVGEEAFAEMLVLVADALTKDMRDVMGEIYMEEGLGNKRTGQFFTPFSVSLATAKLNLADAGMERIRVHEPACGSGGMIIAAAKVLQEQGRNPQRCMEIVAQDLDWKGVYMCYIQLSLLGLDAVVVQGDTLSEPYVPGRIPPERVFYTPAKMGLIQAMDMLSAEEKASAGWGPESDAQ